MDFELKPTIREIEMAVCARFNLTPAEIRAPGRKKKSTRPRQIAMFLAREITGRSTIVIGKHFGGRDHSTAHHAIRKIGAMVTINPKVSAYVDECRAAIPACADESRARIRVWGDRLAAGQVSWPVGQEPADCETA